MPALPTVGGSNNTWGTELNDFLGVGLRADGTLEWPVTLGGPMSSTSKTLHIDGDIAIEYGDSASFIERTAAGLIIQANESATPGGLEPYAHITVQSKGDNATFIGRPGMYLQVRDRTDVDSSNKGVLYALMLSAVPLVARDNVPYDDVACLTLKNEGSGKGTDCVYFGHNTAFTGTDKEWITALMVACSCDYGLRLGQWLGGGQFQIGVRLDEGTYSVAPIRLGNATYLASLNAAAGATVNLIGLDAANAVNIADGGENVYVGFNSATGENPALRVYGYKTGVGTKYGSLSVDASGNFQIAADTSQVLSLTGSAGILVNWGSQANVQLFDGSTGSTTNRSFTITGWDGSAAKTGSLKISTGGIFQMIAPTAGIQIGTATSEKWAVHGSTPTIQRVGAAQAAVTTTAATQTTPWGFSTQAQADAIVTLVNELRAAVVEKGLIKGAA